MDFDWTQFDEQIQHYDAVHRMNDGTALGASALSLSIARAIASVLPDIDRTFPQNQKDKIEFLCSKMVEYSLYPSRRILQGQFYYHIEDFKRAAEIFNDVYLISRDEDRCREWPHLDKINDNSILLIWMGYTFHQLGNTELGKKYAEVGKQWQEHKLSVPEPS